MNSHLIAGAVYLLGATVLSGAPLDDKIKAFEDALKAAPAVKSSSSTGISPLGRALTVEDLDLVIQRGDNGMNLEGVVEQLMATHPSEQVQQTGEDVIREIEAESKTRTEAFEAKANAVLSEVPDAVTKAKNTTDLDGILKDLKTLQPSPELPFEYASSHVLLSQIQATFQFVTQWQNYLSALSSGNMQEAQNSLRSILNNQQIEEEVPTFFPRSEILARLEEASGGKSTSGTGNPAATAPPLTNLTLAEYSAQVDAILAKVKTPGDLEDALSHLLHIPKPSSEPTWDWSVLMAMDKARDDALAGLPVTLNLKQIMNGNVWGDDISRIVAMDLLAILPYSFGTVVSDPPKANETVSDYLDRLSASANTDGNLALLQRVIAMKVALATSRENNSSPASLGTQQFLAGLSQEAGGQYASAVVSYENALKNPDAFLPRKIVGERLAAIKAEHPDDFEKGLTTFMTPAPTMRDMYPGMPPMMNGRYGYGNTPPISVLPIPMTISIPARPTAPPETAPSPATNAVPANPTSPPASK